VVGGPAAPAHCKGAEDNAGEDYHFNTAEGQDNEDQVRQTADPQKKREKEEEGNPDETYAQALASEIREGALVTLDSVLDEVQRWRLPVQVGRRVRDILRGGPASSSQVEAQSAQYDDVHFDAVKSKAPHLSFEERVQLLTQEKLHKQRMALKGGTVPKPPSGPKSLEEGTEQLLSKNRAKARIKELR